MLKGKALLVVTRLWTQSKTDNHFDVNVFIQSCSSANPDARDVIAEEFSHMEYDVIPLPSRAYKLEVGETLRLAVVYEVHMPAYENREDGCELYITKARVRGIQRSTVWKKNRQ